MPFPGFRKKQKHYYLLENRSDQLKCMKKNPDDTKDTAKTYLHRGARGFLQPDNRSVKMKLKPGQGLPRLAWLHVHRYSGETFSLARQAFL